MENSFETIIIGAGVAGLTAGLFLQDAIILDFKEKIGEPVQCGEGLAEKHLSILGFQPEKEWISTFIENTQIIVPNGKVINLPGRLYILEKDKFERFLASKLKAKIQLKTRVVNVKNENGIWKIQTQGAGVYKGKYLIGADGPSSLVRRKIFKQKLKLFPAYEYFFEVEKEIDEKTIKIFFDKNRFYHGYAWIFPKSKKTANIGLGGNFDLISAFQDFLKKEVKDICGHCRAIKNKSGVVPIGGAGISLFKDNAFLVGDAGGLADPIFGGGIGSAILSAKIAAEVILENRPQDYEKQIKSMGIFNKNLLVASEIFYSLENEVLNEVAEVLNKKNQSVFYLTNFSSIFDIITKQNLRKNILKLIKLFLFYKDYVKRKSYFGG